jgi:hypothetical protein
MTGVKENTITGMLAAGREYSLISLSLAEYSTA